MNESQLDKFYTVNQLCEKYSWARPGGIRHLIFHAETNGFSKCMVRMGRRILIDIEKFGEWLEENRETNIRKL